MRLLQTGSPVRLQIYATVDWPDEYEGKIHRLFSAKRWLGEWFGIDDEINDFMNLLQKNPAKAKELVDEKYLR